MPFPFDQEHRASHIYVSAKGFVCIKQPDIDEDKIVSFAPAQLPDLIYRLSAALDKALKMHTAGEFDEQEEEPDEEPALSIPTQGTFNPRPTA